MGEDMGERRRGEESREDRTGVVVDGGGTSLSSGILLATGDDIASRSSRIDLAPESPPPLLSGDLGTGARRRSGERTGERITGKPREGMWEEEDWWECAWRDDDEGGKMSCCASSGLAGAPARRRGEMWCG